MKSGLRAAALIGLVSGLTVASAADTLYDSRHQAVAKGTGTVSQSPAGINWTDCDSKKTRLYPSSGYSIEKGEDCDHKPPVNSCKGQNSCRGKGGCRTGDNGCKGKNSCKGKGGCATDGKSTSNH